MTVNTETLAAALRAEDFAEATWGPQENVIAAAGFHVFADQRRDGLVCVQHLTKRAGGVSRGEYEETELRLARQMDARLTQTGWTTRLDEGRRRIEVLDGPADPVADKRQRDWEILGSEAETFLAQLRDMREANSGMAGLADIPGRLRTALFVNLDHELGLWRKAVAH